MRILYNNNEYDCNPGYPACFTVDMGSTSIGIPVAKRLWITNTTAYRSREISCRWESDGSENIILVGLKDDDCWHDHAEETIHGTRVVELMCGDTDSLPVPTDLSIDIAEAKLQVINAMLTTSIDDLGTTHQRTLVISIDGTNEVLAKITFIGETISEDMDIEAMASLQGLHISPEDMYVFYEADPQEPVFSSELLNRKRKEYLMCIDRLKDKIGSRAGIIDVIKYFGYDDMYIGTLWKVTNSDSPYYKGYSIRYTDQEGNSNTMDDHDVHYKQINRSILVYKIVKTLDLPFDKLPKTAAVNSYGVDGNSVKLARLREVMNEQFMPAAIPIREILGECDVYYAAKTIHKAVDNLTEFNYSEHNIRLSIARNDVYEFRKSRYYMLASRLFQQGFIDRVAKAEKDCLPNTFKGCLLQRLKRIHTIYQFLKEKAEVDEPDVIIINGDSEDGSVTLMTDNADTVIKCGNPDYFPRYYIREKYGPLERDLDETGIKISSLGNYTYIKQKRYYKIRVKGTFLTLDKIKEAFVAENGDYTIIGTPALTIPYFIYQLITPKEEGVSNFVADTYSSIHSEAITLMNYIYESMEYLTDKLHTDALEYPDYLWTVWQETVEGISLPELRPEDDVYDMTVKIKDGEEKLNDGHFIDRYCGCITVSLSCQDAFKYRWNDIHSWWDHTARYNDDGSFKDGMTWVNHAGINKIEWTISLHDNPDIKYTYTCQRGNVNEGIPHEFEGVADYDIYGVPVTATVYVYHHGEYDVEAIIYDNFGHIDRLYKERIITVHPSQCYLMGIAQNVVHPTDSPVEDAIDTERGEDFINKFCNSFIYGPMRYNRTFDNANGILFKLPYFPKIVTPTSDYYLYPFTIRNAVEASERYKYSDERKPAESSPFALPNIIPSQPTALILPLKASYNEVPESADDEVARRDQTWMDTVEIGASDMRPRIEVDSIPLWNTGKTNATRSQDVPAVSIVAVKGTNLYKYDLPTLPNNSGYDTNLVIHDLESLPFFSDYKWQVTYMPGNGSMPILMGIAKTLTPETDIDDIYFAPTSYTEHVDVIKESSPIDYDISFIPDKYEFEFGGYNANGEYEPISTKWQGTYVQAIEYIKQQYEFNNKMYFIHKVEKIESINTNTVPHIQGIIYNAFIGMPHFGTWNFIAGGYTKLKKYSWAVVSIDNNNIPGKHNIVWDIEYRHVLKDPKIKASPISIVWSSVLSDESFQLINQISREDYRLGVYNKLNFPSAYLPYMFTKTGQYRITCTFMDLNGDKYSTRPVVIDIE